MKNIIPLLASFCFLCPIIGNATSADCNWDVSPSRYSCSITCTCPDGTESSASIDTENTGYCCYVGYNSTRNAGCSTYATPIDCDTYSEPYGGHGSSYGYDEQCDIKSTYNANGTTTIEVTCSCYDGSTASGSATCAGIPNWNVTSDYDYHCWVSVWC